MRACRVSVLRSLVLQCGRLTCLTVSGRFLASIGIRSMQSLLPFLLCRRTSLEVVLAPEIEKDGWVLHRRVSLCARQQLENFNLMGSRISPLLLRKKRDAYPHVRRQATAIWWCQNSLLRLLCRRSSLVDRCLRGRSDLKEVAKKLFLKRACRHSLKIGNFFALRLTIPAKMDRASCTGRGAISRSSSSPGMGA